MMIEYASQSLNLPTSYSILASWFTVFFASAWFLSGSKFSPSVAFFGTWLASLLLIFWGEGRNGFDYGEISPEVFRFLRDIGALFLLGTAVAEMLRKGIHSITSRRLSHSHRPTRPEFRISLIRLLCVTSFGLTIASIIAERPDLRSYLHAGAEIRDGMTAQASMLMALASCALMTVIPSIIAFIVSTRRFVWWMSLPFVAILLLSLVSIGKFAIIFLALYGINCGLYQMGIGGRFRVKKRIFFGAVIAVLGVFWITSLLRGSLEDPGDSRAQALTRIVYAYATGYIPAFGHFYDEYLTGHVSTRPSHDDFDESKPRFGNQTFAGIYRLLAYIGVSNRSATNHYDGAFNVYTVHRDLLMDFGVNGTQWLAFAIALTVHWIYRRGKAGDTRWLIFVSLVTLQMEFSLIYSLFGLIFYPICLMVSPFLGQPKRVHAHSSRDLKASQFAREQRESGLKT